MQGVFDQQFELLDSDGEPVPDFKYKVTTASGQVFRGMTDAQGKTRRIATIREEDIQIEPDELA